MKLNFLADKPEFVEWIQRTYVGIAFDLGYRFGVGDPEVDYKVLISPEDKFIINRFVRNEDQGIDFQAERWVDTEKYLTFLFGNDIRRRRKTRMPNIELHPDPKEPAPGFTLKFEEGMERLSWRDAEGEHLVLFKQEFHAIPFSFYQRLSAAELRASFDDPMGRPLLVGAPGERGAMDPDLYEALANRPELVVVHPEVRWGWDENGVAIASQDEWNSRYVKPSTRADGVGEMRWPGNDGSVNGTRVMYFSVEALLEDYPQFRNLDRVGRDTGCVLAVEGTPFEQRGLPPRHRRFAYNVYRLTGFCPENVRPEVSLVAPANGYPGGGLQIRFMDMDRSVWVSVADLVNPKKYGVLE